jgi:hypothetical protein
MLHNPEVQGSQIGEATEGRQFRIRERLEEAFQTLEDAVHDGMIAKYGLVSNGIILPNDHPLYLDTETVMLAASEVASNQGKDAVNFAVLQLPANLLERRGFEMADAIAKHPDKPKSLQIYAMRPLSCYPDMGTGAGHPFVLADYKLPATMEKKLNWSNEMTGPPAAYEIALKTAMQHFDAEEIIQAKMDGKELTADQRETLDGCKLLQSLLHDFDAGLAKVRSFAAHEDELYNKVIPLIHDTFEGYDEETAQVLQSFFGAYSMAVKYSIASNLRKLLTSGEAGSNVPKCTDLQHEMRLQEYGLHFVLAHHDAIDKVMIGASDASQVIDALDIVRRVVAGELRMSADEATQADNS